ncbi:MAG TPA: cation transporter [Nitrospirota bacterium]|jgi:divalent metal cation (Fe/Co/Zn/Cd) transporter
MKQKYLIAANVLALITFFYNIIEGLVSIWFGLKDGTFALFGFGLDSFVEVISAVGIWHMLRRQAKSHESEHDAFERTALRITGGAFYLLAIGLVLTAGINIFQGHKPETTFWGIIVGAISIASMWLLIHYKVKVGKALGSDAILADAACTRTCLQLSAVLLAASLGYELTGIGLIDSLGALAIAWLSYKEGREAFEKAKGRVCACCH